MISTLTRLGDECFRHHHAAMTGATGYCVCRIVIGDLCEVLRVDVLGHPDHDASLVFDWIGIGCEVEAFGLRIARVAELAFDAEVTGELVHELDDVVTSHGFRKNLEVGWIGTRPAGWPGGLCGSGRGVLGRCELSREKECKHYERAPTKSIHLANTFSIKICN